MDSASKTVTLIGCHTSSKIRVECLKRNLSHFSKLSKEIHITNSTEFKGKIEASIDPNKFEAKVYIDYQENSNLLCHDKWYKKIKQLELDKYEGFILTNDSFLIINSLQNFQNLYTNKPKDLTGICDSYQLKYHFPDFLRHYSKKGLIKWVDYFEKTKGECSSFQDMIDFMEVNSSEIFSSKQALYQNSTTWPDNPHYKHQQILDICESVNYPTMKIKMLESQMKSKKEKKELMQKFPQLNFLEKITQQ